MTTAESKAGIPLSQLEALTNSEQCAELAFSLMADTDSVTLKPDSPSKINLHYYSHALAKIVVTKAMSLWLQSSSESILIVTGKGRHQMKNQGKMQDLVDALLSDLGVPDAAIDKECEDGSSRRVSRSLLEDAWSKELLINEEDFWVTDSSSAIEENVSANAEASTAIEDILSSDDAEALQITGNDLIDKENIIPTFVSDELSTAKAKELLACALAAAWNSSETVHGSIDGPSAYRLEREFGADGVLETATLLKKIAVNRELLVMATADEARSSVAPGSSFAAKFNTKVKGMSNDMKNMLVKGALNGIRTGCASPFDFYFAPKEQAKFGCSAYQVEYQLNGSLVTSLKITESTRFEPMVKGVIHAYPERLRVLEDCDNGIDLSEVKHVWPLYDNGDADTVTGYLYLSRGEFKKLHQEKSGFAELLRGDHDRIQDVVHFFSYDQKTGHSANVSGAEILWRFTKKSGVVYELSKWTADSP